MFGHLTCQTLSLPGTVMPRFSHVPPFSFFFLGEHCFATLALFNSIYFIFLGTKTWKDRGGVLEVSFLHLSAT